jgi:hypothetical protein
MQFADTVKAVIRGVYSLSPYFWADSYLKKAEFNFEVGSAEQVKWRTKRLLLSERYIVYWLFASMALFLLTPVLPAWVGVLCLLRVLGILNKELGVILFGICKITEGTMVAASGRVIVLGLVNYGSSMFLIATAYALLGQFLEVPDYTQLIVPLWPLIQAMSVQFTLSNAFTPADLTSWFLCLFQSGFCFMFGTIVISMFVSLLNIQPINK